MIIGIDGHDLEGNRTGVGRYLTNILRVWAADATVTQHRIVLFFKRSVPNDLPSGFTVRLLPPLFGRPSNAAFMHILLPRAARRESVEVLWCPGYVAPIWLPRQRRGTAKLSVPNEREGLPLQRRGTAKLSVLSRSKGLPLVLTLHDIIYEARPDLFSWKGPQDRFLLRFVSKRAALRAKRILVPSHFTADEVHARYGIPRERIVVTPEAADSAFRPMPDKTAARAVASRYGIANPYLFFVGSIFRRRHIPECIRAFAKIAQEFPRHQFLICGASYLRPRDIARPSVGDVRVTRGLRSLVAEMNVRVRRRAIVLASYAPQEDLPALYNAADATMWLSEYEGFGLPPLESLACGTPVVTTRQTSLPETVGDCAVFVNDAGDENEIAHAMRDVLSDPSLRQKLTLCGPQRAAQFSWATCARATIAALRDATL